MSACSGENKPATSDLKKALTLQLPGHISLDSFSVEASQNLGNKVEPLYAVRFQAAVKAMVDLYKEDRSENGVRFISIVSDKGKKADIFGKITSRLYQGAWQHNFDIDGNPFAGLGAPLTQFSGGRVIILGSDEEKKYYAEIEQKQTEQRKNIANAEKILLGKWRDENSLTTYKSDGTSHTVWDNGQEQIRLWSIQGDLRVETIKKNKPSNGEWKAIEGKIERTAKIVYIDNNRFTINEDGKLWNATRVQ